MFRYQLASKTCAKYYLSWPYAFYKSPLKAPRTAFDCPPFFVIWAVFKPHSAAISGYRWLASRAGERESSFPAIELTALKRFNHTGFWASFLPWHRMLITSRVYNQVAYQMRPPLAGHVISTGTALGVKWQKTHSLQSHSHDTCYCYPNLCQKPNVRSGSRQNALFWSFKQPNMCYNLVNSAGMFP